MRAPTSEMTKAGTFNGRCRSRHTAMPRPEWGGAMVATPREPNGGSRPIPDPTVLTQNLVDALRIEIETQLSAAEKLTRERFDSFQRQLDVAERLRLEQKVDVASAVSAALAAQKEQVAQQAASFAAETAKTERNFTEQLKGQRDTFGTAIAAQDSRYTDMKDRLSRIETSKTATVATLGGIASVVFLIIAVIGFIASRNNDPAPADPIVIEVPAAETP